MSQSLPNFGPEKIVTVLAVDQTSRDLAPLRALFSQSNWKLHEALSCRSAMASLRTARIPVVLCERDLPDGTWKDLHYQLLEMPDVPLLIVTSRFADESLWAEVLNLGAYDVLAKPFERSELVRVVGSAWLHWKHRSDRKRPATQVALRATATV